MRFNPFVRKRGGLTMDEPPAQITNFGGIAQVRPLVGVFPQEAPDSIKQGRDTPGRPARYPIAILTGIEPNAVAEGRFVAAIIGPHPHATYARGAMAADGERSNIAVPPHVAYGSLFIAGPAAGFH